jgi:hypothetical protein
VVDDLGRLAEAGLTTCTLWLPIGDEHMAKAMEWIATEIMPQLTDGRTDRSADSQAKQEGGQE